MVLVQVSVQLIYKPFCFTLGSIMSYSYIGAICFYYRCAVVFRMSQEKIQKKVEPFLHMVPIGLGLGVSVHFLVLDMYNQTDGMPWCTLIPLPNWCIPSVGNGCVRGVRKMISVVIVGTLVSVDFVVVTDSLFLVVRHMYGQHTILKQYIKQSLESTEEEETLDPELLRQIERGRHCLKAVSIHSIAYICCFIVTLFF